MSFIQISGEIKSAGRGSEPPFCAPNCTQLRHSENCENNRLNCRLECEDCDARTAASHITKRQKAA